MILMKQSFTSMALGLIITASSMACKESNPGSNAQGLSANPNSTRNAALFVGMPGLKPTANSKGSYLYGVRHDTTNLYNYFTQKSSAKIGFAKSEVIYEKSTQEALLRTAQVASQVSDDGTLFWYYSGHGLGNPDTKTGSGDLFMDGHTVAKFSEILGAIRKGTQGRKLKRVFIVLDSCFSSAGVGSTVQSGFVPGNFALTSNSELDSENEFLSATQSSFERAVAAQNVQKELPFQEAILIASSSSNEVSNEISGGGLVESKVGGVFTLQMVNTLKGFEKSNNVTVGDFLRKVTAAIDGKQHPRYWVTNNTILAEPLFSDGSTTPQSPAAQVPISTATDVTTPVVNSSLPPQLPGTTVENTQIYKEIYIAAPSSQTGIGYTVIKAFPEDSHLHPEWVEGKDKCTIATGTRLQIKNINPLSDNKNYVQIEIAKSEKNGLPPGCQLTKGYLWAGHIQPF